MLAIRRALIYAVGGSQVNSLLLGRTPPKAIQPKSIPVQYRRCPSVYCAPKLDMVDCCFDTYADFAYGGWRNDSFIVVEAGRNGTRKLKADYTKGS